MHPRVWTPGPLIQGPSISPAPSPNSQRFRDGHASGVGMGTLVTLSTHGKIDLGEAYVVFENRLGSTWVKNSRA